MIRNNAILMIHAALIYSSAAFAFDFSRVYEMNRRTCNLQMMQVFPAKSAGYQSTFDVVLTDYKIMSRDERGNFGETLYFSKLTGLGLDLKRKDGKVATTQKIFTTEMSLDPTSKPRDSSKGTQTLRTTILDAESMRPLEGGGKLVLLLKRTTDLALRYDFTISLDDGNKTQIYYSGRLSCN